MPNNQKFKCLLNVAVRQRKTTLEKLSSKSKVSIGTLVSMGQGKNCQMKNVFAVSKALRMKPIDIYPDLGRVKR